MTMTHTRTSAELKDVETRLEVGVYAKRDVAIVRGSGVRLWDAEGNEYLDMAAGHGVANHGHAHPRIVAAIAEQAATLVTCSEGLQNDRRAELLERLIAFVPDGLERAFLCNSGTEAIEAALKFARIATGRTGIVATMRGFHGRTMGALSATWEKHYRTPFMPLVPGFEHVAYDDLDAMKAAVTKDTAAVLVEVVQGEGGVRPASHAYLAGLRELCDATGALLVIDEVQTGFGRTGRRFACEHAGVVPDILAMGKALGGGLPMGAVAVGARVPELPVGTHGSTFGGNPLSCAAALAGLDVMEDEHLVERSAELGAWLLERARAIDLPIVREVRGLGLMLGIELRVRVASVVSALMKKRVIAIPAGPTVLRLLPPLVVTREELACVMDTVEETLREAAAEAATGPTAENSAS
jgi:acetylornithine/LysW-gamma-L-lysine aminotransferase